MMKRYLFSTLPSLNMVLALWLLMVLGCASGNTDDSNKDARPVQRPDKMEESKEFKESSPPEHLAEAKKLFTPQASETEIQLAARHLKAIPETAPEHAEAQKILSYIDDIFKVQPKKVEVDRDALQVANSSWRKGAFGVAGIWTVTFYNRSDKPIGDIKYHTRYYSETGNDLGGTGGIFSEGVIQKVIPPRQKRTIKINDGLINKEAARGNFEIVGWKFIE